MAQHVTRDLRMPEDAGARSAPRHPRAGGRDRNQGPGRASRPLPLRRPVNSAGRTVFVDTSAWLALANRRDRLHEAAAARHRDLLAHGARSLTTEAVLAGG